MAEIQVNKGFLNIGDQTFSFSFEGLDLTTLAMRRGDFSIDFEIPDTSENRKKLDLVDDDFLNTNDTYQKIPATVIVQGLPVRQGYLKITGQLTATFFGGNADWIDLLSGSIKDVDLSDYDHVFNSTNIKASRADNSGYCYPLINYGTFTELAVNGVKTVQISNHFDAGNGFTEFSTSSDHNYTVGDTVRIIDYNVEAFNGVFTIVDISSSSRFTVEVNYSSTTLSGTPRATSPAPMQYNYLRPSFYVHTLLEVMFREIGWKLDGEVMEDFWFKKLILAHSNPSVTRSATYAENNSLQARENTAHFIALGGGGTKREPIPFTDDIVDPNSNWDGLEQYTPPDEGMLFDVTVSIYVTAVSGLSNNPAKLQFAYDASGTWTRIGSVSMVSITGVGSYSISGTYSNLDDTSNLAAIIFSSAGLGNVKIGYGQIEIKARSQIQYGNTVDMATNLPDIQKIDLMRYVFNHRAIVPVTNPYSKTLTLKFFKNIKQQTAEDWTAKIENKKVDFSSLYDNYGKKTWFRYKHTDNDPLLVAYKREFGQGFGDGFINIDNDFIDNEKTLYEAPFAATVSGFAFKGTAYVPYIPVTDQLDFISEGKDPAPRILYCLNNLGVGLFNTFTAIAVFEPMQNSFDPLSSFDFAFFSKTDIGTYFDNVIDESLAFDTPEGQTARGLLDRYFQDIDTILQRGKIETFRVKMSAADLAAWDQTTPIYIFNKGGGKLYFRNKLVNFDDKEEIQTIELIPYG